MGALDLRGEREFEPARLGRMAAALRHRGPDGFGGWMAPGIAMATRRLALVDPAGGAQPVCESSGRVWASVNGELFEHRSLRRTLRARGHAVPGECDSALWPALYLEHGEGVFEAVRGQFAVAIWDASARTLLLGRDRVGICPLHYAIGDGGWLLWGSEIKALLASGLVRARLDAAGVDHMFSLFAAGTRRTCFAGVSSIWPGHYLRVRAGELAERRYWDLEFPEAGAERQGEPARLAESLRACLEAAVVQRVDADAPVAALLSGGLDSTLALALAARARPGVEAFTVALDAAGPDERVQAARAARLLGVRLHRVVLDGAALVDALPQVVMAAEGPVMDMANACVLRVHEAVASRGFKAVLTGEGADEALGGYVWHRVARAMGALGRVHGAAAGAVRGAVAALAVPGSAATRLGERFGALQETPALLELYGLLGRARGLFYSDALMDAVGAHDPFDALDVSVARMQRWHPLNRSLYLEYKVMLPGHLLLGKGDRMGMGAGVEGRYPYLDENFVALCAALSPSLKLRGARGKWLLREVARSVLPPAIADPPKTMFKADSLCSLGPLPRWAEQLLSPSSLGATGLFSPERVAWERRLHRLLPAWSPRRFVADASFTAVVTTQLFHHQFLGGGLCELPEWTSPAGESALLDARAASRV